MCLKCPQRKNDGVENLHLRQTFERAVSVLAWLHMGTDLGAVCDLNTTYGCVKAALEWDCKRQFNLGGTVE